MIAFVKIKDKSLNSLNVTKLLRVVVYIYVILNHNHMKNK